METEGNAGPEFDGIQQFLQPKLRALGASCASRRKKRQGGWLFPNQIAGGDGTAAVVDKDEGAMTLIPVHMGYEHWGMIVVWWSRNQVAWADSLNMYVQLQHLRPSLVRDSW